MAKFIMCRIDKIKEITPSDFHGIKYRFMFSILPREKFGTAEQDNLIRKHEIVMGLGETLMNSWLAKNNKFKDDQNLIKILYQYALEMVIDLFEKGEDEKQKESILTWNEKTKKCPFNPDKIRMVIAEWVELEIQTRIGF